jgi:predicted sulfurtransferase
MYCTGGIRCELASAYIRDLGVAQDVKVREKLTQNEV